MNNRGKLCNSQNSQLESLFLISVVRKLKKLSADVTESLSGLSLEESPSQMQANTLCALQNIYSFTCTQPTQFPHTHCQEFTQQLQHLPTGKTLHMLKPERLYTMWVSALTGVCLLLQVSLCACSLSWGCVLVRLAAPFSLPA